MNQKTNHFSNFSVTLFVLSILFLFQFFIIFQTGNFEIFNADNNTISGLIINKLATDINFTLPVLYFIASHALLHLIFIICSLSNYRFILRQYNNNFVSRADKLNKFQDLLFCSIFILFNYFLLLIINTANYPYSNFALQKLTSSPFILSLVNNNLIFLFAVIYLSLIVISGILIFIKQNIKSNFILLISLLLIFIVLIFDRINLNYHSLHANNTNKPNLVLLTIDSLRYDYLSKINSLSVNDSSNKILDIPAFVQNSVLFTNAYTPLARSFPALYSLLSGKHPAQESIRFNLTNQKNINFSELIASKLQDQGYETLYATDSNQFHIINENWGYKYLVTPKQGVYEQLFPKINDLPLSNLIINTKLGSLLFPYTYSNQSAHALYDPLTYVNNIFTTINKINKNAPLFLHLNFEAAHWPYQNRYLNPKLPFQERYKQCINTANWQIKQVFDYLANNNLLNNTLVILATDHGEALSIKDDKITKIDNYIGRPEYLKYINKQPVNYTLNEIEQLKQNTNKDLLDVILDINTSGGHGVDVLSKSQYQVIISIQKYLDNKLVYTPTQINDPVTLTDIYPTIMDLLNINTQNNKVTAHSKNTYNTSLAKLITNSSNKQQTIDKLSQRNIFLETGLQVPYFKAEELQDQNILKKFIQVWSRYYHINQQNHLELTDQAVDILLQTKQYAIINNSNILAYIPNGFKQKWRISKPSASDQDNSFCDIPRPLYNPDGSVLATLCGYYDESPGYYVYYNQQLNKWTLYPDSDSFKNIALINKLHTDLKNFYKNEIVG